LSAAAERLNTSNQAQKDLRQSRLNSAHKLAMLPPSAPSGHFVLLRRGRLAQETPSLVIPAG
jgi:hypothetical protein